MTYNKIYRLTEKDLDNIGKELEGPLLRAPGIGSVETYYPLGDTSRDRRAKAMRSIEETLAIIILGTQPLEMSPEQWPEA